MDLILWSEKAGFVSLKNEALMDLNKSFWPHSSAERIERIMCRGHVALNADCFTIDLDLGQLFTQLIQNVSSQV